MKITFLKIFIISLLLNGCSPLKPNASNLDSYKNKVIQELISQTLIDAKIALDEQPITVTHNFCERSSGAKNDFYSEGDYWWPDESNPNGPYIQKDGLTNPNNFVSHRLAMIRFNRIVGLMASAYEITKETKYLIHAQNHLKSWFINSETKMNPHLEFAQAIKGKFKGRGIGIIDTIHLLDIAQSVYKYQNKLEEEIVNGTKKWFAEYLDWMMNSKNGNEELKAKNNHGTCFVMQIAIFAKLTDNKKIIDFCKDRYKTLLLPNQMAKDGSFPLETVRTKPYGYSLFNIDAMVTLCQILSDENDNLFDYKTNDGLSIKNGLEFIAPYILDKNQWKLKKDVMYWEEWPVAHPSMLFGANVFKEDKWFDLWKSNEHFPKVPEVIRNLVIKYPIIWM